MTKECVGGSTCDAALHKKNKTKKKTVVNKKRILLSTLYAIHHANELCADQAAKTLK